MFNIEADVSSSVEELACWLTGNNEFNEVLMNACKVHANDEASSTLAYKLESEINQIAV